MTRITAPTPTSDVTLEDHEPYKGTLKNTEWATSSEEYGGGQRLVVDWDLGNDEDVRDWINLKLGKQKDGKVAKLRALLNALSDKPADTEIAWFDDSSLEWSYDGETAHNKLYIGAEVVFRGINGKKADGGDRYSIQVYQAPKKKAAAPAGTARKFAPAPINDDEVPF